MLPSKAAAHYDELLSDRLAAEPDLLNGPEVFTKYRNSVSLSASKDFITFSAGFSAETFLCQCSAPSDKCTNGAVWGLLMRLVYLHLEYEEVKGKGRIAPRRRRRLEKALLRAIAVAIRDSFEVSPFRSE